MLSRNETPASTYPSTPKCSPVHQRQYQQSSSKIFSSPPLTSTFSSTSRKTTTVFPPSVLSPLVIPSTSGRSPLYPFSSVPTRYFPRCCGSLLRLFLRHPIRPQNPSTSHPEQDQPPPYNTPITVWYRYSPIGLSILLGSSNMCIWLLQPPRHLFDRMLTWPLAEKVTAHSRNITTQFLFRVRPHISTHDVCFPR
jgi:hypothetical protein